MDSQVLMIVLVLLLGVGLGAALSWLLLKAKAGAVTAAEQATLKERLTGRENDLQRLQQSMEREVSEHKQTRTENAHLKAQLEGERRAAQERISSFNKATEELS